MHDLTRASALHAEADGETLSLTYFSAPVWGAGGRRFKSCRSIQGIATQKKLCVIARLLWEQDVGRTLLCTLRESICFTRRGSAIETRHHPPTHKTDFESDAYTSFIPLAFKVRTPYGIPPVRESDLQSGACFFDVNLFV